MRSKSLAALMTAAILMIAMPGVAQTNEELRSEIAQIKKQVAEMEQLKARVAELERKLEESEKAREESKKAEEAAAPAVTTAFKTAKAKIDGRIFTGVFETGDDGPFADWSTDINDAKLRFTFNPSKNVTIVNRLSTTGARAGDFDYFYLDLAGTSGALNTLRIGQRKVDVGQETWVDNPVENMLVTTSGAHVSGYATGIALLGKLQDSKMSPVYELGFVNGPRGDFTRPTNSLPFNVKVGASLPNNLFASASYFDSGDLGAGDKPGLSVAEILDAPSGATEWRRKLWELDVRYNYGPTGIRALLPTGDLPPIMLGATYGAFGDDATGVPDRDGKFWFVEGLVKLSTRAYAAARYSSVDLDDGVLDKLVKSPAAVNSFTRTSIGLGYALSDLTELKTEYTINDTSGGSSQPSLNQWAVGLASKF